MTYQVKIDIFEGPLDLLLHLIQKDDLDIYDIPISDITARYLSYLEIMKDLNLNVAGEFLVMAVTLMQIKARTLLPSDAAAENEGPDPRAELVQRLLEYQKFKEASKFLSGQYDNHKDIHYRGAPIFNKAEEVLDVSLTKLLDAFNSVLETAETSVREILVEEIPVEVRIREILDVLDKKEFVAFSELFPSNASRKTLVVSFLALLELIRLKQVRVTQSESFAEIHINKVSEAAPVGLL
jgi:segregation and condensation protein A